MAIYGGQLCAHSGCSARIGGSGRGSRLIPIEDQKAWSWFTIHLPETLAWCPRHINSEEYRAAYAKAQQPAERRSCGSK